MTKKIELKVVIVIIVSFIIYVGYYFNSISKDREFREKNRSLIIDSLFNDISFLGELLEIHELKHRMTRGGSPSVCCFNIIGEPFKPKSFYNSRMRIGFRIERNIAVIAGCHVYENLSYIAVNEEFDDLVTMYNSDYEIIKQIPLGLYFRPSGIVKFDLQMCNHLIER